MHQMIDFTYLHDYALFLGMAYFAAMAVVHIGFAAAIATDAAQLKREGSGPLIVGPFLWTVATLLGGVLGACLYWVVNHSTLSRR